MKNLISILLLLIVCTGYAQTLTEEQAAVMSEFYLQVEDHRGVELQLPTNSCSTVHNSINEAITAYFNNPVRTDFSVLCIQNLSNEYQNKRFNILELVNLYIETSN